MVFSRRFSSEKCPTIAVASFVSFFFVRPNSSPCMYHFLCIMQFYQKYSALDFERIQKPLTWNTKPRRVPLFQFCGTMRLSPPLFRLCEPFFEFFWKFLSKCLQRVLQFFLIFCNCMDVEKAQSAPFYIFFSELWDCSKFSFFVFFSIFF